MVAFMSESAMMRSMLTEKDSSAVHLTDRSARNSKEKMNHRSMEALASFDHKPLMAEAKQSLPWH